MTSATLMFDLGKPSRIASQRDKVFEGVAGDA